ncbi:Rha family transcriptional regulator [Paenibacillus polymyxa]|uniref:Rha family transcriptional regulator n=1 Tax=Paenibacillus polymyxa TaxID=1406 RepID=UPI000737C372|nr:Rha family transcriptional regulator [Paenibacillus polymyxa]
MTQLVFIENGQTVTDSLTVAEVFGKEHRRVMQDIRTLECSEEFNLHNFVQVDYTDSRGRTYPKYIITQDGFSFLAMSYTGKEAARFKEMYITEFNRMKDEISKPPVLTERQAIIQSLKLTAEVAEEVEVVKATTAEHGTKLVEIEQKLDKQITLNSGQQRTLQRAISKKVYAIEPDKDARGELFQQLHREIKDRWQVTSYKDVLRKELENVLNYITYWRPIKKGE